ncbi:MULTISPECIES: PAS domain S-box protein [unclassified Mucilaginibacter]|uniref:PAS domain-containing sensor histidine kinase n=1 Tax=unclassified Mucilaginibacter TaxID=2617802 RepID=UPI002AC93ADC|nr:MULTISPECIES: PAS domain S-box protein [unclassified Mucilaginibacter]MEB0260998.1 PAS domain S-box protein [Mucilaginibacter sp. 10I4]MEB0279593.1 PAS domain S-box protein [Mucilaginibacter sp. 10B2]MEB0300344.1 PAS domain S-box protein [Mucilaginibacter sp. 5C4]WPX22539.1 PAS domain S-box protein [Mucilaginibacter sp. 5C4]
MEDTSDPDNKLAYYQQKEIELQLKLEKLTDFVENASLPLHWVDGNGIIIWANQAELDLLGYTKEEYLGFPITDFHADETVITDILNRLVNNETLQNYPAKLKCKNGSIKHVLINSNVLNKDGVFVHTRCFTRDITELKEAGMHRDTILQELEQSEAKLKMVIASVNLGTWDWEPKTGLLTWSDECKKIYGLPLDKGVTFEIYAQQLHPDDKERVLQEIQDSMDAVSGGEYDIILRIIRFDDGATRWVRAQGKVYFDVNGQVEHFIGTVIDITESRIAAEKSAKLAAIVESSDDIIISKTLDGIITSWNASAQRTFGYTPEEVIGHSILMIIPEDRQDEEPMILSRLKNGERVEHFETVRITKDRRLLNVSLTISPIKDEHGKTIGFSKIARDITGKKQEELRKNDFIAMVSHELKTPLTAVKSYIQILLAKEKNGGDAFKISALSRAEVQTKKMTSMIQDFLSLARLEEGKIQLNKEVFELHTLIEEVADDAQFLTSTHTVKLHDCEDIIICADRDKIGQVLMNLLSNAIKYSPRGGTIVIGCVKLEDKVKIFVKDEGVGINIADQKKLFDKFYRVKNEKVKTISGFGIGLYLVSELLRYHKSKIEVESREDEGATFYFVMDMQQV